MSLLFSFGHLIGGMTEAIFAAGYGTLYGKAKLLQDAMIASAVSVGVSCMQWMGNMRGSVK